MKKGLLFFLIIIFTHYARSQPEFNRGVNLTGWFQVDSPRQIQFTKYTSKDFENIKSLGCDVIRLPINLHAMTSGSPDYVLDPLFLNFIDQAVGYAEDLGIYLILDNHTFDPAVDTDPNIGSILVKVWKQMAEHYKDYSDYVMYEVLNEPHGLTDQTWNAIQQDVIDAIREVDTRHTIVVGASNWNNYQNLQNLPEYDDENLIYTFHFYDPFLFTHQGANWVDPSMESIHGVPFPYDFSTMPSMPPEYNGTWVGSLFSSYATDGTTNYVKQLLDIAINFKNQRNAPVFCGEFGVYRINSDNDDRVFWYDTVRKYLEQNGIAWTIWDYQGGFGIFKKDSPELFDYDVNIPMINALGLNVPEQNVFIIKPDSTGFSLYVDYISQGIIESGWAAGGTIDFYDENHPVQGEYCLLWSDGDQYGNLGFDFKPDKDLSYLVDQGFILDLWVRGNNPDTHFNIRFTDTKTSDPGDHPWRMYKEIKGSVTQWNGNWQQIKIPLSGFTEQGAWDNDQWFNPEGKFDWHAVDRFDIVADYRNMQGIDVRFDYIRIVDPSITALEPGRQNNPSVITYPNPFNNIMSFKYYLSDPAPVIVYLFNSLGKPVKSFIPGYQFSGEHILSWDGRDESGHILQSGIYFYSFYAGDRNRTGKVIFYRQP